MVGGSCHLGIILRLGLFCQTVQKEKRRRLIIFLGANSRYSLYLFCHCEQREQSVEIFDSRNHKNGCRFYGKFAQG